MGKQPAVGGLNSGAGLNSRGAAVVCVYYANGGAGQACQGTSLTKSRARQASRFDHQLQES